MAWVFRVGMGRRVSTEVVTFTFVPAAPTLFSQPRVPHLSEKAEALAKLKLVSLEECMSPWSEE